MPWECWDSSVFSQKKFGLKPVNTPTDFYFKNKKKNKSIKMADQQPIYSPFFGVMGAASAIIFSGKIFIFLYVGNLVFKKISECQTFVVGYWF